MSEFSKVTFLESITNKDGVVDREKGMLLGVKVIQLGRLNDDRPFFVR